MDKNLFQNDYITGNSKIGFEFKGQFTDDENVLLEQLKNVLNRKVTFSNIEYKLLEPTDNTAVMIQDGNFYEIKTPMYSYFEALFIMPKILDFLKGLKEIKNSYLYFRIGFDPDFCDISQLNVMKFVLEFKEDYILKNIKNLTTDGSLEKLADIKPRNLESCTEYVQKELDSLNEKRISDIKMYINKLPIKISVISVFLLIPLMLLIILSPVLIEYFG